jgi:choline-sulfatase
MNDESKFTRRTFLQLGAGTLAALSMPNLLSCSSDHRPGLSERPNFLIILTDQERQHTHWPEGWTDKHVPSWSRLKKHGVTFTNAYCSSSMCSPSRACLLTSEYSNVNGMPKLGETGGMPSQDELPNIASLLKQQAGYDVVWKGKWHLSYPLGWQGGSPSGEVWTEADIGEFERKYGFAGWNPPDAGTSAFDSSDAEKTFGGGRADNDGRYVRGVTAGSSGQTPGFGGSAVDYLAKMGATPPSERKPFCLFVSLVNPHDIAFYPEGWETGGYKREDFAHLGIELPLNYNDSLSTKPDIQCQFKTEYDQISNWNDVTDSVPYVNFYAYLHSVVDQQIKTVLDALEANGLTEDTVVIRTADHGEMGLSHGLREKSYTAYEEMINIPLVISNPKLFPVPRETAALYSHVDLLPTIAELAGIKPVGVGKSMLPVLQNPKASVQDSVLFAYDDDFVLEGNNMVSRIRALRTDRWTYAVYYNDDGSVFQYELYDNDHDSLQMINLLYNAADDIRPAWHDLHQKLTAKMKSTRATPQGFDWPDTPREPVWNCVNPCRSCP